MKNPYVLGLPQVVEGTVVNAACPLAQPEVNPIQQEEQFAETALEGQD